MRSKVPGRSSWCALLTLGMGFQLLDGGGGVMVKSSSSQIRFPSLTQAVLSSGPMGQFSPDYISDSYHSPSSHWTQVTLFPVSPSNLEIKKGFQFNESLSFSFVGYPNPNMLL